MINAAGKMGSVQKHQVIAENIDLKIEQICQLGCARVNSLIGEIQAGKMPGEMSDLNPRECHQVLEQLESIMSIYG